MITFKKIFETPTMYDDSHYGMGELKQQHTGHFDDQKSVAIGEFNGHSIIRTDKSMGNFSRIHFDALKDKRSMISVSTEKINPLEHKVRYLSSHTENTLKAHDLYHHLVNAHGINLVSDGLQTKGAAMAWKKLHSMPGVNVTVRHKDGSEHPPEANWDDNYTHFDDDGEITKNPERKGRLFVARKA